MRTPTLLVAFAFASACGGSTASEPRPSQPYGDDVVARTAEPLRAAAHRGDRVATGAVGQAGGSLELSNGSKLVIAPRALSENVEVTVSLADDASSLGRTDDEKRVGPSLNVMPAMAAQTAGGFVLTVPFVSLPDGFSADDVALAVESPHEDQRALQGGVSTRTRWDYFPARVVGSELKAELSAFPGLRVQFVVAR